MKELYAKIKEALVSTLPITIIVYILALLPWFDVSGTELITFSVGAVLLIVGLGLFSLGADLAMTPMGNHVGAGLSKQRNLSLLLIASFMLGMLITIAEPDLQVLASQVSSVMNGTMLVYAVGIGVGSFLLIAVLRIVFRRHLSNLLMLFYMFLFAVGTDNFDLPVMRDMGLQVGVIANHNSVAEFALTLILSVLKNLPRLDAAARNGQWARFPMGELTGKTVGIVGFGRIGRRLAELLQGFHTDILVYDPYVAEDAPSQLGARAVSLGELLACSDVVSLHLPYTPENHHLMNAETIAQMKDGAYLINTARGPLVDEKALYNALTKGKLSGVALDVFEKEPISRDNPLLTLENAVFAPHVSALSYETNYNGSIICARSIIQVAQGGKPVYSLW